ncbi:MAG TPA: BON domain-containing protein [Candidatus Angelobacter sp.]|jgi:osmotically-inducible protein OsmY|nr:BON domain-containing protein [Candidatus Angelobacter sp.]
MRAKGILPVLATAAMLIAFVIGCNTNKAATPDVKDQVSHALGNAGFKDVKVSADNDKQLVTLHGDVKTQEDKERAEDVAKTASAGWVVANEIGVRPEGVESAARKIDSNVDSAIEKDFKAVLIANHLDSQHIRYDAKNGVLTLKGDVDNTAQREDAEKLAATVPNVQQVVNELDVKGAKAKHKSAGE